jgi:hypothetical protein
MAFALLHRPERAHVAQDAVEIILAPHGEVGGARGGIDGHAEFVEPRIDQRPAVALVQQGPVRVEENVDAPLFKVADHAGQVAHQHRLADAVKNRTREIRQLIDDGREQLPAHVGGRLELGVGARTSGAEQIAAVRHLQIEADRRPLGRGCRAHRHRLVVATRVDEPGFGQDVVVYEHGTADRQSSVFEAPPGLVTSDQVAWRLGRK